MRERRRSFAHVWLLSLAIFTWRRLPTMCTAFVPTTSTTSSLASFPQSIRVNTVSMNTRKSFLTLKKPTCLRKATSTLLASNAASEDSSHDEITLDKERALGILVLLSVPLSWGTYGPVVRYLYELQPPVPGFVFSASYYVVASLTLLTLSSIQPQPSTRTTIDNTENRARILRYQSLVVWSLEATCFSPMACRYSDSRRSLRTELGFLCSSRPFWFQSFKPHFLEV